MIVPDVNLLVQAHDSESAFHVASKDWWETALTARSTTVGLPWVAVLGFLRVSTNPRAVRMPMPVSVACSSVRAWLAEPHVTILHPGDRHAEILLNLLEHLGVGGNLTTDAHLAALAIEHQAELHSTDADFSRFPGLRWRNPLQPRR